MKRYGNIYENIYSIENLRLAHKFARKDKSFYKDVKKVDGDPDFYLGQIHDMWKNKTYKVSEYTVSPINDKGKQRILMKLPYFPDRIIQWAILLQIEHIFVNTLCGHTCASLKGRGIKRAMQLMDEYMKDEPGTAYCLKLDVTKFYPNINHEDLKRLLRKKFKDNDLLELLDLIIDSYPGEKGVPIGSYLSQYLANFYLAYFDHWLKEEKRIKYVVRYMDDIVIMHESKAELHKLRRDIGEYLRTKLNLSIKTNWQVFPVDSRGVDFVGYRFFHGFKLLRKSTCKKFKRRMLDIKQKTEAQQRINYSEWCSANSYKGWLKWCNSYRLQQKYVEPIQPALDRYYDEIIKSKKRKVNKNEGHGNCSRQQGTSATGGCGVRHGICS